MDAVLIIDMIAVRVVTVVDDFGASLVVGAFRDSLFFSKIATCVFLPHEKNDPNFNRKTSSS